MWIKYPIVILMLLFAAMVQISFLPYFGRAGGLLNLIFMVFFMLVFFEPFSAASSANDHSLDGIFPSESEMDS